MFFDSKRLLDGRWGIFVDNRLIASIGSFQACKALQESLEKRLKEESEDSKNPHLDLLDIAFEYLRSIKLIL